MKPSIPESKITSEKLPALIIFKKFHIVAITDASLISPNGEVFLRVRFSSSRSFSTTTQVYIS